MIIGGRTVVTAAAESDGGGKTAVKKKNPASVFARVERMREPRMCEFNIYYSVTPYDRDWGQNRGPGPRAGIGGAGRTEGQGLRAGIEGRECASASNAPANHSGIPSFLFFFRTFFKKKKIS